MTYLLDELEVPRSGQPNHRLFVGRADAAIRRVTNMDQLRPLLTERGFRIVDGIGRMSLGDQIELFAGAAVVVAVHGAGVTNCIFRRQTPCALLELHADGFISEDFERTAHELGWTYSQLPGDPVTLVDLPGADFAVPPERLARALDQILA
jgi:capsular polysaccharide biosynthesis protein